MKILQVSGSGQAGSWLATQIAGLLASGHTVDAVLPNEGPASQTLRDLGVDVRIIPFRGFRPSDWPRVARGLLQLGALMRGGDYDVVHAHLLKGIILSRLAAAIPGAPPLVSQVAGVVQLGVPWLRRIEQATVRWDSTTIASCHAFADTYRQMGAQRVRVDHYGIETAAVIKGQVPAVDARREMSLPDDVLVFGMIAHMYPTSAAGYREIGIKGHEVFLDAARIVLREKPDLRFVIIGDEFAGDGSYRARLEARVADLPESAVSFLGARTDASKLVSGMDVLVVPSLSESASYAAMEGSLGGKPVIASRVGGLPDTVLDERTGLLVEPARADQLAEAMLRFVHDPALRRALGEQARMHVQESMDVRATVATLEDIYREAVAEPRPRKRRCHNVS